MFEQYAALWKAGQAIAACQPTSSRHPGYSSQSPSLAPAVVGHRPTAAACIVATGITSSSSFANPADIVGLTTVRAFAFVSEPQTVPRLSTPAVPRSAPLDLVDPPHGSQSHATEQRSNRLTTVDAFSSRRERHAFEGH